MPAGSVQALMPFLFYLLDQGLANFHDAGQRPASWNISTLM